MFHLSGAVNVLLFLIVRPHLLLFTPPEEFGEPKVELAGPNTSSAIIPDMVKYYDPKPQLTGLGEELMDDV